MFEQTPSVVGPGTAHDLQVIPLQLLAQHTPCSQKPVAHSLASVHATPFPLSTQTLPLQKAGAMQSAAEVVTVHLVLHTLFVVSQANRPGHVEVAAGRQVPAPSQLRGNDSCAPVHDPAMHWVPDP